MKKTLIIIGIICGLLFATIIWLIDIGNAINEGSPHISENIKDSKEIKAFVAEYKFDSVSPFMIDSLKKYNLSHINFSTLEYWIEKKWGLSHKYLFFEQINYSKYHRLLITGPTSLKTQSGHPFMGFKIKNLPTEYINMGGVVCPLDIDSIPEKINLEIYLNTDNTGNKYIGDITIKKADN